MQYLLDWFRNTKSRDLLFLGGYALYLVFGYVVVQSPVMLLVPEATHHSTQVFFWIAEATTRVVLFALVLCCFRFALKIPTVALAVAAGAAAVTGFLVIGMISQFSSDLSEESIFPWLLFGGALLGAGDTLIILLWAQVSSSFTLRTLYLFVLLSNVLGLTIHYGVSFLPGAISIIITVLLFLVSAFCVWRFLVTHKHTQQQEEYSRPVFNRTLQNLFQPLAGTALLFFMAGLMQQISEQDELPPEVFQGISFLTSAVVVLCLLLPALLVKKPLMIVRMYTLAIPLSAAGFLLLPLIWNGAHGIVNSFVQLGAMVAGIVLWCLVADISHNTKLPSLLLFALTLGCINLAELAGALVGFLSADTLKQEDLTLTAVALVAVYLILMAALFLFKDKSFRGAEPESRVMAEPVDTLILRRSETLSADHQLTAKESEILLLLAQGYTVTVISEKLVVSENTVKSHVKSIYSKLNIHSRSDLIKLVNSA